MAHSANTVWEVRTTGSDDNGGAFQTGASGTDFSQQNGPQATLTAASVVNATTTRLDVSAGDYTVEAADVGNMVKVAGGTATPGFYQITAATTGAANQWTVDRSLGTAGQTCPGRMGGALASIGGLGLAIDANNTPGSKAYIQSGTYTLTSSAANVSGGTFSNPTNETLQIIGYSSAGGRTDISVAPVIDCGAITSITVFDINNGTSAGVGVVNVTVDGQGGANNIAFDLPAVASSQLFLCTATDCTTGFMIPNNAQCVLISCRANGCTTGFTINSGQVTRSWADGCTTGFQLSTNGNSRVLGCLATDGTTGFDTGANTGMVLLDCTADGNSGDGFLIDTQACVAINCLATNNGGWGIDFGAATINGFGFANAAYNNTSGNIRNNTTNSVVLGTITLTADPYVNAAGDDYRPNDVAGGGADIRGDAEAVPGQITNNDIGAVQHSDPTPTAAGGSFTFAAG